uniref:hydrogenase maturation protease n=2 Tax=Corynebacteriaceae TaxID=1653 RepID=UPI00124C324B|nr:MULTISPECIES: hydrogenase maturation protease [Corynebacterium]
MAAPVTVVGIGNPIMSDDGIGLELLRQLATGDSEVSELAWVPSHRRQPLAEPACPGPVEFIDGGTSGMEILPVVQQARRLLLLDAIAGAQPGQVTVLRGDQLPRLVQSHLSPHQVSLLDLLAAARLLGTEPEEIAVVGVVPASTELSVGLSEPVIAALPEAVAAARTVIADWLAAENAAAGE